MQKLKQQTPNKTNEHLEQIATLFPNVMSEGKVDFDLLRQMLSDELVEGSDERYRLDWVGKKASLLKANSSIDKTLRPCREESVAFDTTQNLYLEGDNFEVLKLIQESYLGKVKMIYIDPPYNTGKDFVYRDNFTASKSDYEEEMGLRDEEENKLFKNTDSNGRFHSDWLSMMYERLLVSRDLLKDDGVIFISIDDNEVHNLRKICDEVFGESNFVGEIIRKTKSMTGDDGNGFNLQHENLVMYSKNKKQIILCGEEKDFKNYKNPDNDLSGDWTSGDPSAKSGGDSTFFEIINPNTQQIDLPPNGRYWAFSKGSLSEYIRKGRIKFKKEIKKGERGFIFKRYKNELQSLYNPVNSLFSIENDFMNQNGTKELKEIFTKEYFENPKPIQFIKKLLQYTTNKNDIVLDFFSGSATTAHAVMQLNAEDQGSRKYICIQLQEETDEKSEAYKAGYKNICEIGKERIRRAGKKILEENQDKEGIENLDVGFRVLKVDSSNMKDVYYHPTELGQGALAGLESNIKEERSEMDLLFATMLELGIELSLKITPQTVDGINIYVVANGELVACFADNISTQVIDAIKTLSPLQVVLKDGCFANDNDKINGVESLNKVANVSVL